MNQFHANVEHRILTLLKQKDLILNSMTQRFNTKLQDANKRKMELP